MEGDRRETYFTNYKIGMKITTNKTFLDVGTHDCISAFRIRVMADMAKMIDEEYRLYVNDKPKYLPNFFWKIMVKTVLKVTITKK